MNQAEFILPKFIQDEDKLSKKLGYEIGYPIRVFNLQGLGIDQEVFIKDLAPSFRELAWDYYDVKRDQVLYLIRRYPGQDRRLDQFLPEYYANRLNLDAVKDLLEQFSEDEKKDFAQIVPYRKRSISRFILNWDNNVWKSERMAMDDFTQVTNAENDYRVYKRVFAPTSEYVTEHVEFRKLLILLAEIVRSVRSDVTKIKMTCHQMSLVATPKKQVTNAPEGIHQDGADYIVSALVMERRGVKGGESRVYGSDKVTPYLAHTLLIGEALFQSDSSSPLWHDVTPVSLDVEQHATEAVRSIFGFDINIVE
jgi:hypothetical protein